MLLSPYRVLDLSDERGQLAGMAFADLGAEVILIEPPGGSPARRIGPFVEGAEDDPERSLWFWSYNRGKKSVCLDIDDDADRSRLLELVAGADILIDSDTPGAMAARGLGPDDLAAVNPQLVHLSLSAFGHDGPKAHWAATDITVSAAAMHMRLQGDSDRAPLRVPLDQAFLFASAEGAAAALIALHERHRSGRGQHIDVSAQQALSAACQSYDMNHLYECDDLSRESGGTRLGPFHVRLRSPAADGFVSTTILFGVAIGPFSERLFEWIHSEGGCEDSDLEVDWIDFVEGVLTGRIPATEYGRIQDVAAAFTSTRTKQALLEEALARRLLMVPIATVADVADNDHYTIRDFWRDTDVDGVGQVRITGPMAKFSATPLDIGAPPPRIGEHTEEVLGGPARAPVPAPAVRVGSSDGTERPLTDVKILDFMWVMAGPASTRVLADWGAQVVRVESTTRVETARTIQPFLRDEGGVENSGLYQNMNAGKLGITIDIAKPESRDLILDLVRWADIVTESFSPKAMAGWGLSYDDLREVKPDIIMASTCLFGQNGPMSSLAGFGSMGAAMSGFYEMTGWPDRDPAGVFAAYTDYVSPKFLSMALMSALDHRDRTGEGQYIDLSQAEASMAFLAPSLLDYEVNGRLPAKLGNAHPTMSPHAAYPAAGDDQWIAISCATDEQWRGLCAVIGADDLASLTVAERRERTDEIDERITAWTSTRDPEAAHDELQAASVAAHSVQTSESMARDPQLVARRHFREVAHGEHGTMWVEGPRFSMSRSADEITDGGPTYGQHTFEVLGDILGYDADRIAELAVAGVLE